MDAYLAYKRTPIAKTSYVREKISHRRRLRYNSSVGRFVRYVLITCPLDSCGDESRVAFIVFQCSNLSNCCLPTTLPVTICHAT